MSLKLAAFGSDTSVYVLLYMLNDKKWARQIARHLAAECAAV